MPVMDRNGLGGRCKVIPQVFYELEFLRWAQIKDRGRCWVHLSHSYYDAKNVPIVALIVPTSCHGLWGTIACLAHSAAAISGQITDALLKRIDRAFCRH